MTMTQMEENEAPPAAFAHITAVWSAMKADATKTEEGLVYEGYMTKLITEKLKLAIPYYTTVTQALKGMDCAQQLQRGGGSSASRWLLKKEPKLDEYRLWEQDSSVGKRSTSVSQTAILRQMVRDHESRLQTLEDTIAELLEALQAKGA
jgi:hypothetical protein